MQQHPQQTKARPPHASQLREWPPNAATPRHGVPSGLVDWLCLLGGLFASIGTLVSVVRNSVNDQNEKESAFSYLRARAELEQRVVEKSLHKTITIGRGQDEEMPGRSTDRWKREEEK